jgi:hypothetical protein
MSAVETTCPNCEQECPQDTREGVVQIHSVSYAQLFLRCSACGEEWIPARLDAINEARLEAARRRI